MDAKWVQLLVLMAIVVGLAAALVRLAQADARRFCDGYQPVPSRERPAASSRQEFERAVLARTDYCASELREARRGAGYGDNEYIECMWLGWQWAMDAKTAHCKPYDKHWGPVSPPKKP
jgi:hypothetical protein